mmetsp:Transcript_2708/g.4183  ORF Transcript_2708/g.4183 Transcript_2708/m.4183 type:complete len:85 (-) Transcript_2708:189-443(-)
MTRLNAQESLCSWPIRWVDKESLSAYKMTSDNATHLPASLVTGYFATASSKKFTNQKIEGRSSTSNVQHVLIARTRRWEIGDLL